MGGADSAPGADVTAPTELPGQLTIGEALRDVGTAQVAGHHPEWMARALEQLRDLAQTFPHLTADDLRSRMAHLQDEPGHHNAYGSVFLNAARAGWLEATDATCRSERPDAHARRLQVWRSLCLAW